MKKRKMKGASNGLFIVRVNNAILKPPGRKVKRPERVAIRPRLVVKGTLSCSKQRKMHLLRRRSWAKRAILPNRTN